MKYTIKDEKGNMICSIENVDPARSSEGILGSIGKGVLSVFKGAAIATGACIIGLVLLILGKSKSYNRETKETAEKLLKTLGSEKVNYMKKYFENTYTEIEKNILNLLNKNKSSFSQLIENTSDNAPSGEIQKASKSMISKSELKTFNFEFMINTYYKTVDLKKMGIKMNDETFEVDPKYEDKLDQLYDKAISDYNAWFDKSLKQIKLPLTLSNGSKIVSIQRDKDSEFSEVSDSSNCEYIRYANLNMNIEYSPDFIKTIIIPLKESAKDI